MKVYVVTRVDAGWDCVRGVFSNESLLANFFNGLELVHYNEETDIDDIMDFTGMSANDIQETLYECGEDYYIIHEETLE